MYLELCSSQQLKEIYEELNITDESLENDVKYLVEWLEETPHLPKIKNRDVLEKYIIGCKNSIEKAKAHMDYYYSRRSLRQDLFALRDPCCDEIKRALKFVGCIPFPKLTPECYRVNSVRLFTEDSDELPKSDWILSSYQLQYEVLNKVDINKGMILIVDFRNVTFAFATLVMQDMKKIADLNLKTCLLRWKRIIILNDEPIVHQIIAVAKKFLNKKLADRIEIWKKKVDDLVDTIPKDVLPSTYGGNAPPLEELRDQWYEYIGQFRDWFKSEETVNADISLRPTDDPLNIEFSSLGTVGSFRKIGVD